MDDIAELKKEIEKMKEELEAREESEKAFTEFLRNEIIPYFKNKFEELKNNLDLLNKLTENLVMAVATNTPSINKFIEDINAINQIEFDELNKKIEEFTKSLGAPGSQSTANPTPAPPQAGAVAQGSQPGPAQATAVQSGEKAEKPQVAGGQPAVQPEKQQVSQPEAQPEKDKKRKVNVNLTLNNISYVALIKGKDSRYGYKREFVTERGKVLSNFTGDYDIGDILEVKFTDGTKKYFKVTGRTISGVEDATENDLPR